MALGILDSEYRDNLPEEKASDLAVKAIKSSIQRDASSGDGIDILTINQDKIIEHSMVV